MTRRSSDIAPRAFTRSSRRRVHPAFRSTRRTASIARRATSRTRPRISTGSHPKAAEDRTIRTCSSLIVLAALIAGASPASASQMSDYVAARAAQMQGDEARSARLFAAMANADPADKTIARRAIATAIQSGQGELAVSLAKRLPLDQLPVDARLMLAADALRKGETNDAI